MASTVDPFAAYRNGQEASPVDKLKDGDFEELKLEIRNMYRMMFKDEVAIASLSKSGTVPSEPKDVIVQYLEAALAMSPDFQKAVLEEYVTPYMYNFSDLRVKEEWAIGVFLPGFYSFFDTFEAGFAFIKKVLPDAATTARMTIETLIRKHIPGQMQALRFAEIRGPVDSTISQTNPYIATLFQLIQEEKKLNDLRARSSQTLGDLNNILPDLEGAQDLQALYKKKLTTTVGDSLIDRFTGVALGAAKGLGGIPELVSVDTASVREAVGKIRNLVDFAGDQAKEFTEEMDLKEDEEEDEEEVADDDQDDIEVPTEHVPDDRSDTDELPEEALVAEEVRSHYAAHGRTPIFYPGWAPPTKTIYWESSKAASSIEASQLSQGSNLQSQEHSTASISGPSATLATKLKRSHGFISARGLSHKEIDDIDRKVHTPQDVLNGAISYIRQATSKESDRFNAAKYQQCVAWLVKTNKRSDKAEAAKHSDQWFRMFCGFQMEDNWVHVRFLIEALRVECEGRSEYGEIWKLLGGVERILVIAFALIRCGADDPLPWILVVDGVLRKLLRKLGSFSSSGEPTLLQKKVFGELALWCHGTAINAFIIRLPPLEDRYVKGQELMKKWYRMVWTYNPRCANNDCMRLLTHPDNMANKKVRELMSVGTREARVGSRSMRSFISTNRDCAYTCLFEVFRNSEPNGVLVILLFWYSHLYHNRTCKAHSGKPAISAF